MRSSFAIVRTSASCGTFLNVDAPAGSSAAASSGSAAFFAPLIGILPVSLGPPSTTILSMGCSVKNAGPTDAIRAGSMEQEHDASVTRHRPRRSRDRRTPGACVELREDRAGIEIAAHRGRSSIGDHVLARLEVDRASRAASPASPPRRRPAWRPAVQAGRRPVRRDARRGRGPHGEKQEARAEQAERDRAKQRACAPRVATNRPARPRRFTQLARERSIRIVRLTARRPARMPRLHLLREVHSARRPGGSARAGSRSSRCAPPRRPGCSSSDPRSRCP